MIPIKTEEEIVKIKRSVQLLVECFKAVEDVLMPDITTDVMDEVVEETIHSGGGRPAFKGYKGYPRSICVSVESEVVHGIPGDKRLHEGEIVSVDIGVVLDGFYSDAAKTYGIGDISDDKQYLIETTKNALYRGIRKCCSGNHLSDISHAIQQYAESRKYGVVRVLVGHGIGTELHEEPQIPNFGPPKQGPLLKSGMVFAIEPMINMGTYEVEIMEDGWTVKTKDGLPSAHFEHMVLITDDEPVVLTAGIENTNTGSSNG